MHAHELLADVPGPVPGAIAVLDDLAEAGLAREAKDWKRVQELLKKALSAASKAKFERAEAEILLEAAEAALEAGQAEDAGSPLARASEYFEKRGDVHGRCRVARLSARIAAASGKPQDANAKLRAALEAAKEGRDLDQEAEVLAALVASDAGNADAWKTAAQRVEATRHVRLMNEASLAMQIGTKDVRPLIPQLLDARRRHPADAAEIDGMLAFLQPQVPPRLSPVSVRFAVALKKTIEAGPEDVAESAVLLAEIGRRTDALPIVLATLPASKAPRVWADAIETLATREDFDALLGLVSSGLEGVPEAAGAAILRLAGRGDVAAVKAALDKCKNPSAALSLQGVLARFGDPAALGALQAARKGPDPALAVDACAVLGALGFASPALDLLKSVDGPAGAHVGKALAKAPWNWGTVAIDRLLAGNNFQAHVEAARATALRGEPARVSRAPKARFFESARWLLPRDARERCTAPMDALAPIVNNNAHAGGNSGDIGDWLADRAGIDTAGRPDREKNPGPIRALAKEEEETAPKHCGAPGSSQTREMVDVCSEGTATYKITVTPQEGRLEDNSFIAPFTWQHELKSKGNGGFVGALYEIQIQWSDVISDAKLNIPGFAPITMNVDSSAEMLTASAPLPVEKEGEGLSTGEVISVEKLKLGTITFHFKFLQETCEMTFGLAFVVPPHHDKPDLVAEELLVDPPVPVQDEEAVVTLRCRNMGKEVKGAKLLLTRWTVENPQASGGKRTLESRIFDPNGWRPGEWKVFSAKPKFVEDYYMNIYSQSWTIELGDTKVTGTVDANGDLDEEKKENNSVSLEIPLHLSDEDAKRYAEQEILDLLAAQFKRIGGAKETFDVFQAIGESQRILKRAKVRTPDIEAALVHITAAGQIMLSSLRADEALAKLDEAVKAGKANPQLLASVAAQLIKAQSDLLNSGVPTKLSTIDEVRNITQAAAGVTKAFGDYGELGPVLFGRDEGGEVAKAASNLLNKADGIILLMRYKKDMAEKGEADTGDVIEATANILGSAAPPGLSKLHQELLKAEIAYVDKGFRKEAGALNALSDLISGKPGAQERLDAACKDVGAHVSAGPFNAAAAKEVVKGWVKDIPILGPVCDAIWSWKSK